MCPVTRKLCSPSGKGEKEVGKHLEDGKGSDLEVFSIRCPWEYTTSQHSPGWKSVHAQRYHTHMLAERKNLKDDLSFSYGKFLRRDIGLHVNYGREIDGDELSDMSFGT